MLRVLKKDVKKAKKMMYEQNGNINKETENLKRNKISGATKYNKWNEKYTRGIQRQMWASRRKKQQLRRQDYGNCPV